MRNERNMVIIRSNGGWYIDGNTVRKEQPAPKRPEKVEVRRKHLSVTARKNREKAKRLNAVQCVTMAVACLICVIMCVQVLMAKAKVINMKHQIRVTQSRINELRVENNALEDSILLGADLDYIYKYATQKLGMVYPTEDQVIRFDRSEEGYVHQNEDIPTENWGD